MPTSVITDCISTSKKDMGQLIDKCLYQLYELKNYIQFIFLLYKEGGLINTLSARTNFTE